jgi:hypothetical protein
VKKRKTDNPPGVSFRTKSCTGKKKYRSEAEALDMISTQAEYGKKMDDVHPYRCEFCNKWHLGHRMSDG